MWSWDSHPESRCFKDRDVTLHYSTSRLDVVLGLEPRSADSKSDALPLGYTTAEITAR